MHITSKLSYRFRPSRFQVSVYADVRVDHHSVLHQPINILPTFLAFQIQCIRQTSVVCTIWGPFMLMNQVNTKALVQ